MGLQLLENGWDSLGGLFRKCLKWFGTKRTRQCEDDLSFAGLALFWAEMECFVYLGV